MMNPDTTLINKMESRLKFIYKEKYNKSILSDLINVISSYGINSSKSQKWSEKDVVLITYGDSIKNNNEAPLQTLRTFLNAHLHEQLTVVHILPFFPYSSDDGFSVIDFRKVNPELGNWSDIKDLTCEYDLMVDLVINHTSSKSQWFKNFLKQQGSGKDYFITEDPQTDLSEVTRPRSTPLLTPYETAKGTKHVWTTFSADQVDLNFANPELLVEMMDILLGYINKGARIIRLDAIAFLWKIVGTNCLHLPETHEVVKLMRDVAEFINPDTIILTETNVPNKENLSYFGHDDEAHMVYQFSLPPLLLHALHTGNSTYLTHWAKSLPKLEGQKTFFNFTASHDGIGVRPLEGLLPDDERNILVENMKDFGGLVNYKSNPDGSQSPYELNITYFDALKGTSKGEDHLHAERFVASQICMMSLAGIPAFYIHSLTATPNYHEGVKQTQHNRTINRRKWQLEELQTILNTENPQRKIFESLKRLILLRKKQAAFHPNADQKVLDFGEAFFALKRKSNNQTILVIINLKDTVQEIVIPKEFDYDLISGSKISSNKLLPYQCLWLIKR